MRTNVIFLLLNTLTIIVSCKYKSSHQAEVAWQVHFNEIGTFSSPRMTDLNQDGIMDVVMGAGGKENTASDTAIIALDGNTGHLLWKASGTNQFVGSAVFQDITGDGIPEVFIGGRCSELVALNGANGQLIWRFLPDRHRTNQAGSGLYNFTTPQLIPDQNQDGLDDLLISNGGDPFAPPNNPDRPAGRLMVLSSSDGKILANVEVPDGKETYMSMICIMRENNTNPAILFGTGGETIGGSLFRTTLNDIMREDISEAKILATSEHKGFIGSPVWVDITLDGIEDIVVNAVDGQMLAINGANDSLLWKVEISGTEAYGTPAVGYFNADSVPDFFTNFGIGVYPNLPESVLFMVDGKSGKVQYKVTVQGFQYAGPVVADLYGEGFDAAIINKGEIRIKNNEELRYSYLLAFDFNIGRQFILGDTLWGINIGSTPWLGDLDFDGDLDIIYSAVKYNQLSLNELIPEELTVARYKTGYKLTEPVIWGAYQGSNYNAIFPNSRGDGYFKPAELKKSSKFRQDE